MRTFLEAATAFPTFLFTVPSLVAAAFWLLVAVGAAGPRTFDGDADLGKWGLGGVPVAVAFSLWTGLAWFASLGAAFLLDPVVPSSGWARASARLGVLAAASTVSWCVTRALVQRLRPHHPDEPGATRPRLHDRGVLAGARVESPWARGGAERLARSGRRDAHPQPCDRTA
ncbi:hypothetical protein [Streptomyces cadmiisoli]|uniref:hypothetical protein n=1 Tax=Streptomyces cadmiisoli TaxID=2184053 RepID=UPI00366219F4